MCFLAWPFVMAWGIIGFVFSAACRLIALGLGTALVMDGSVLCTTANGIDIGVPIVAFGVALMLRAIC